MNAAVPSYMRDLPKDRRGFPITFTSVKLPDGRIDFTTSDPRKWELVTRKRLCALCGKPLLKRVWFIGGPKCMEHRLFFDPAMHEECARYSLIVCPYLAMPSYLGAKKHLVPEEFRVPITSSDTTKPQGFGLAVTDGYEVVEFQDDILVKAKRWTRPIEWWKDGERIAEPPAANPTITKYVGTAAEAFDMLRSLGRGS